MKMIDFIGEIFFSYSQLELIEVKDIAINIVEIWCASRATISNGWCPYHHRHHSFALSLFKDEKQNPVQIFIDHSSSSNTIVKDEWSIIQSECSEKRRENFVEDDEDFREWCEDVRLTPEFRREDVDECDEFSRVSPLFSSGLKKIKRTIKENISTFIDMSLRPSSTKDKRDFQDVEEEIPMDLERPRGEVQWLKEREGKVTNSS